MDALRLVRLAALGVGVAVAFADSSIVVLALPDVLREFDASIPGVSWVITSSYEEHGGFRLRTLRAG